MDDAFHKLRDLPDGILPTVIDINPLIENISFAPTDEVIFNYCCPLKVSPYASVCA